jgi:leader peptidase (prepilin peptidase)/N-methyltransferase
MIAWDGIVWTAGSIILGLVAGGFLNVVIYRLPRIEGWPYPFLGADADDETSPAPRLTLSSPGSHCPGCGHRITAIQMIPLVGYAVLRGACARCGDRISARYPTVELLAAAAAASSMLIYGPTPQGFLAMVLAWFAIAIGFIDAENLVVPDVLSLALLWTGLAANAFEVFTSPSAAIFGAAAGYIALWVVNAVAERLLGRVAVGQGDFKLFAAIGAWLGWQALAPVLLFASTAGVIVGYALVWFGVLQRGGPICFAPFLLAGALVTLFVPDWYLTLLT